MENKFIILKESGGLCKIEIDSILFVSVQDKHCQVVTRQFVCKANHPLHEIIGMLSRANFVQVHRSFVVNMNFVSGLSRQKIIIDEITIPVSRSCYTQELVDQFFANSLVCEDALKS